MKLIKILCVTLYFLFLNTEVISMAPMPFRVGFEFQMSGELCKWAMDDYSIQKRPIFEIGAERGKPLFHVELDGPDIEFVTIPFSNNPEDKRGLETCTDLITSMTAVLMRLTDNPDKKTTIAEWIKESSSIKGIWIQEREIFAKLGEQSIEKPTTDWLPTWQPQVTLQHPLQCTINLLDNLFVGTVVLQSVKEAKPFYNPVLVEEKPFYDTAIGGLIFLLAHEMCGINKSTTFSPQEAMALMMRGKYVTAGTPVPDADMISDTLESFRTVHQFDAKRRTLFMSRRPFSDMLSDILKKESAATFDAASLERLSGGFAEAFKQAMAANNFYRLQQKVAENFWRANYSEQFFNKAGRPLDLKGFLDYFDEETRILPDLREVLANGILSTAMLRHIDLERAITAGIMSSPAATIIASMRRQEYYDAILASIDKPELRLFLNVNNESGIHIDALPAVVSEYRKEPITVDLFSPPFPLDKEDAMGFFREGTFPYPYLQQTFGSAIVEIRAIQHVKMLLDKSNTTPSGFLTNPLYLKSEVENLYGWLSSLTIKH